MLNLLENLFLFFLPYLFVLGLVALYRWGRAQLEKSMGRRPLFKWEKRSRRVLVLVMVGITIGRTILANRGLALRPNLSERVDLVFLACGFLWLVLVISRRFSKTWNWAVVIGTVICLFPGLIFTWLMVALSGNGFEYDFVTENGKAHLHTSEQAGWHDHYVHKYEVVNDYLMKAQATDYDIHNLSEQLDNINYEEKYFSRKANND